MNYKEASHDSSSDSDDEFEEDNSEPLKCVDCDVDFPNKGFLYNHLKRHIQQPILKLDRVQLSANPPLKITLKNRSGTSFEIISPVPSPVSSGCGPAKLEESSSQHVTAESEEFYSAPSESEEYPGSEVEDSLEQESSQEASEERAIINFSPNLAEVIGGAFLADITSPIPFEAQTERKEKASTEELSNSDNTAGVAALPNGSPSYGAIPGAEPTPPPDPSPTGAMEYPKIKIKTTGLFKDPEPRGCTITEITEDNPTGDPSLSNNNPTPIWTTPSLEDPLKLPDSENLITLFNNDRNNKDLGYSSSSENEFISLDTFNERNRAEGGGAVQLYNPSNVPATSSSIESLTGLPMQALAQQVSRLNPPGGQGLHQQNVLINIQQFPSQPHQPYPPQQHPPQPMYPPHYPPHPGQPPMHQPYPYQPPPNPMYPPPYPPGPGYPPQHPQAPHMPPPQHPMGQMQPPPPMGQQPGTMGAPPGQPPNSMVPSSQGQSMPPPNQIPQPSNGAYRPPVSPSRPPAPRGPQQGGPRPLMNNRAPGVRPRAPMVRPRGAPGGQPLRGQMRPRMGMAPPRQGSPIKRGPDLSNSQLQAKRRRVDVLTPSDKDDDDCQVICMQPKNTGLPQIESVHGASESVENSIMKLSDSITLSVRNPPPKPAQIPQKSDAKAVANVLASRGITVTASGKPKETPGKASGATPTALSLNGAVSIVAKANASSKSAEGLPTVDLTEDSPGQANNSPNRNRGGLPFRCELCPAQYPSAAELNKHRQTYHKTNSLMCELGVPLINLKHPGIMQKLSQLGINNYVPLSGGAYGIYAMPIINAKNPGNVSALGATQMLSLGPVRAIPRPGANNANNATPKK